MLKMDVDLSYIFETKVDDLEILMHSLTDTFIKYLLPEVITEKSKLIGEGVKTFKDDASRENKVEKLMEWILDNKSVVYEFANILWTLIQTDGPVFQVTETDIQKELPTCIAGLLKLVIGSSKHLSKKDWDAVIDQMFHNKFIAETDVKRCKDESASSEIYLHIFRSIRCRKPDWPVLFIKAVKEKSPTIFDEVVISSPRAEAAQSAETKSEGMSELHHEEENEIFDNSGAPSLSSFSTFSQISDSTNFRFEERFVKINLQEDRNSVAWKELKSLGAVDAKFFTTESQVKTKSIESSLSSNAYFSDENEETDEEDNPSLTLRKYQEELAVNALKGRNTIICAPTGSGKTRVATHIIIEHLQHQKDSEPKRKIAFFARTVPLVIQQYKSLKKYLPKNFEVTYLTGDSENSMHLHMIMPDNDVIVMTPRILENHFRRECLPHLGVFSMLVFDECHHTRKGEPYNKLMYSYLKTKTNNPEIKLPQIVGLTASISVEKAVQDKEAIQCILKVCGNLDAESISVVVKNEEELKATVPVPEEKMIPLKERENDKAVEKIVSVMSKLEDKVKHYAKEINRPEITTTVSQMPTDKKSQQYGQWAVKIKNIAKSIPINDANETNLSVRYIIIIADYLAAYNVALETHDLVQLRDVLDYLERYFVKYRENERRTFGEEIFYNWFCDIKEILEKRKDNQNPNLQKLQDILRTYLIEKGEKSCGIIFVRTRALTDALTSWLKRCDDESLRNLKGTVFTGTAASVDQGGLTQSEQEEIIQRFRAGKVRLLVATSVGEEGLDIPECNLVIKYNHVGNEVTTVQTRGRSRKHGGMSILLAMKRVLSKERINQQKAEMMMSAIKSISLMKRSQIRKENKKHQLQILKDEEISEIVRLQEERMLHQKEFKMVCHLCRKLVIHRENIRTIFDAHRVVVDRNILKLIKVIPYKDAKNFDEVQLIGSVRCRVEPEPGKHCNNKLGSMMIFSKVPFVVLNIKSFGFDTNSNLDTKSKKGLDFYNQWKKVPYLINRLEPLDIERYLPEKIERNPENDEADNGGDSEDDDDDCDDSKRNKSHDLSSAALRIDSGRYSDTENPKYTNTRIQNVQENFDNTQIKSVNNVIRNSPQLAEPKERNSSYDQNQLLSRNKELPSTLTRALNDFSTMSPISIEPLNLSSGNTIGPVLMSENSFSESGSQSANGFYLERKIIYSEVDKSEARGRTEAVPAQKHVYDKQPGFSERSIQRSIESNNDESENVGPVKGSLQSHYKESEHGRSVQRSLESNDEGSKHGGSVKISIQSYYEESDHQRSVQRSIESSDEESGHVGSVQRSIESSDEESGHVGSVQRSIESSDEESGHVGSVQRSIESSGEESEYIKSQNNVDSEQSLNFKLDSENPEESNDADNENTKPMVLLEVKNRRDRHDSDDTSPSASGGLSLMSKFL